MDRVESQIIDDFLFETRQVFAMEVLVVGARWEPIVDPALDPYGTLCAHERELQSYFVIEHGRDWSSPVCAFAYHAWRTQCEKTDAYFKRSQ
jgi:hypothetical protein